jgi:hypothetical protein
MLHYIILVYIAQATDVLLLPSRWVTALWVVVGSGPVVSRDVVDLLPYELLPGESNGMTAGKADPSSGPGQRATRGFFEAPFRHIRSLEDEDVKGTSTPRPQAARPPNVQKPRGRGRPPWPSPCRAKGRRR